MRLPRRQFLHLAAGAASLPAMSRIAEAQTYPTRPITMIVPFAPGGPSDVAGRVLAGRMKDALGQPVMWPEPTGASLSSDLPARGPMAIRLTSVPWARMCSPALSIRFHTMC